MFFVVLLLCAAISLSAAAGYFSIIGLSETYAASFISIIIVGAALEVAKIILASFLHNYWNHIKFVMKSIGCVMLITLMFITSYGVFSHLVAAYQQDNVSLSDVSVKLQQDKDQLARLIQRKNQMDEQIAKLPNNYVSGRARLIKTFGKEYTEIPKTIDSLNKEIQELSTQQINTKAKIGPIIYIAKALNADPDKCVVWFTGLITLVMDPLAITLIFAYNIALIVVRNKKKQQITITQSPEISDDKEIVETKNSSNIMNDMYSSLISSET